MKTIKNYNYSNYNKSVWVERTITLIEIKQNEIYKIIVRHEKNNKDFSDIDNSNFIKYNKAKAFELFAEYYGLYLALENYEIAKDFE